MSTDADTDDTAPPAAQPAERELGRLPRGLTLRTDDGVRWVTCDALSHGDYGGYVRRFGRFADARPKA